MSRASLGRSFYELVTDDEAGHCRDIPDELCQEQPGNFTKHGVSLASTKTGDALMDPKLVLAQLFALLGVPAALTGLLVPVREAGALLPQLFAARHVRSARLAKRVWALGSALQGVAVAAIVVVALRLDGLWAGVLIVLALAVFAVARSLASVSYKEVLGKTISKATRGTVTGAAATTAGIGALAFGALLTVGPLQVTVVVVALALTVAAVLWFMASVVFLTVKEPPAQRTSGTDETREVGDVEGGEGIGGVFGQLRVLRDDPQLLRFIVARGLLVATALAPPYLLVLSLEHGQGRLGVLGPLVIASAAAQLLSSVVWGRAADRSSRRVLLVVAGLSATVLGVAAAMAFLAPARLATWWAIPGLLFALMLAYHGVRVSRATHIVDMAPKGMRATYAAVANTSIGIVLVVGAGFGVVAERSGVAAVLALFGIMCLAAIPVAWTLHEVQRTER